MTFQRAHPDYVTSSRCSPQWRGTGGMGSASKLHITLESSWEKKNFITLIK